MIGTAQKCGAYHLHKTNRLKRVEQSIALRLFRRMR